MNPFTAGWEPLYRETGTPLPSDWKPFFRIVGIPLPKDGHTDTHENLTEAARIVACLLAMHGLPGFECVLKYLENNRPENVAEGWGPPFPYCDPGCKPFPAIFVHGYASVPWLGVWGKPQPGILNQGKTAEYEHFQRLRYPHAVVASVVAPMKGRGQNASPTPVNAGRKASATGGRTPTCREALICTYAATPSPSSSSQYDPCGVAPTPPPAFYRFPRESPNFLFPA